MKRRPKVADNGYKIVLLAVVDLLKQQGLDRAGEIEGLNAYQALCEVIAQAEAFGVPLADIGLAGFDPDVLLSKPRRVA